MSKKLDQKTIELLSDKKFRMSSLYKIVDKEGEMIVFTPNPPQQHFINNKHKRNIILKSRRLGFCLEPSTRVLTADLNWVEIKKLKPNTEIVAIDEFPPGGRGKARKMRTAKVIANGIVFRQSYKITFDDGRFVICTGKHPWLSKKTMTDAKWRSIEHKFGDRRTSGKLDVGTYVRWITKPWEESTYEDGWYGGILDGEGSISKKSHSAVICASQRDGDVLERMIKYHKDRNYHYSIESKMYVNDDTRVPNHKVVVGRLDEIFKIIGQTRASRFIKNRFWEGRELPGKRNGDVGWAKIIKIEKLDKRKMVDLETSTGTYIAEGFVSHNTTFSVVDMLDNTLFNKNYDSLFISYDSDSARSVFDGMAMLAWNNFPLKSKYQIDLSNANQLKVSFSDKTTSKIEIKSSGRGGRYNQIHVSEFGKICAKYPHKATEIVSGTIPALIPNGELTIESTAEGEDNLFHNMFWESWNSPADAFDRNPKLPKAHFYNWQWDKYEIGLIKQPDAQIPKEFIDIQRQHNEKAKARPDLYSPIDDIQLTYWFYKYIEVGKKWNILYQEYPITPEDAFRSSGTKLFDQMTLHRLEVDVKDGRMDGDWLVYEDYKNGHDYAMGVDPAEGVGGDHSAITIIDFTPMKPRVVATYRSNTIPPDQLAYEIREAGRKYSYPLAAVERNNTGFATITTLKGIYPEEKIFKMVKEDKYDIQETDRLGWLTTLASKPRMFYDISSAVNDEAIYIPSRELLHEMKVYGRQELSSTKTDPESTNHFDLLTSFAICFQMRSFIEENNTPIVTHTNTSHDDIFSAI